MPSAIMDVIQCSTTSVQLVAADVDRGHVHIYNHTIAAVLYLSHTDTAIVGTGCIAALSPGQNMEFDIWKGQITGIWDVAEQHSSAVVTTCYP